MGLIAWKQKALLYVSRATLIIISLLLHTPVMSTFRIPMIVITVGLSARRNR